MGLDLAIETERSEKPVLSPIIFLISLADNRNPCYNQSGSGLRFF